jgi:GNAT superfamily N-acetyltransferase
VDWPPARRARDADVPKVVRLVSVMFGELGTPTDPSWAARTQEALAGRLWVDLGIFVVDAADPGAALAACSVGVLHRSLPSPRRPTEITGYLEWVVTHPGQRRRGHARSATAALLAWLTEQGASLVDVHSSAAAEPLYRQLGFTDDGPVALRCRTTTPHGS